MFFFLLRLNVGHTDTDRFWRLCKWMTFFFPLFPNATFVHKLLFASTCFTWNRLQCILKASLPGTFLTAAYECHYFKYIFIHFQFCQSDPSLTKSISTKTPLTLSYKNGGVLLATTCTWFHLVSAYLQIYIMQYIHLFVLFSLYVKA